MTDKEFNDSFTTAGGRFIALYGETILDWTEDTAELAEFLYSKGHDKDLSGTKARIYAIRRLIKEDRFVDALKKIQDSSKINKLLPGADIRASDILRRRFPNR